MLYIERNEWYIFKGINGIVWTDSVIVPKRIAHFF